MPFIRIPAASTSPQSLRQALLLGGLGLAGGVGVGALVIAAGAGAGAATAAGLVPLGVAMLASALLWRQGRAYARLKAGLALLDTAEDVRDSALIVEDSEAQVIYANTAAGVVLGSLDPGGVAISIDKALRRPGPELSAELALLQGQARGGRGGRREVVSNQPRAEAHWLDVAADPLPGGLLVWRVRDVTPRRRQLDKSGDRLALLSRALDKAPFGIVLTDSDLVIREANSAFRGMVENQSVTGRAVLDLVLAEERPALERVLRRALEGPSQPADSVDVPLAQPEGKVVTVFASQAVVNRGGGGGLLLHVADSTERRRLELQFAQSQKMQAVGQLAGGIAHDFNNMLTAIIGFCDLMLQRFHPGDQTFADTMQIKQNANRAAGLVRQLLAFSRQQTVRPRVIDLTDVIADLANLLRRLLSERIELKIRHQRDLWPVKVDQGQFEQVVINLAVNARDAMPDGGRLSIETANVHLETGRVDRAGLLLAGDYVRITVSDTGIGIPKTIVDKIFDPFFTTKEVGAGTGLGLSMVYGSITQAGGQVTVDSEGPGKGAAFTLYLPRHERAAGEAEPATAGADEERDTGRDVTGGGTILLVEDEDAVRLFAARALRSKGYRVIEARTGEAALALLNAGEERYDLIVTDMMMPELDGASLIREARKKAPDLPVICISGYTQDAMAQEVFDLPRVSFLPKPFSLKQLAGRVKDAIESPDA